MKFGYREWHVGNLKDEEEEEKRWNMGAVQVRMVQMERRIENCISRRKTWITATLNSKPDMHNHKNRRREGKTGPRDTVVSS